MVPVSEELHFPVTVGAWRLADASIRVFVGDTEEGFDHSAKTKRGLFLEWPSNHAGDLCDIRSGRSFPHCSGGFAVAIDSSTERERLFSMFCEST
jgi:cystathionine beta-lyase/cystathionine gamma-synthase